MRLFGITNCDTVKRARAWLVQQGAQGVFYDFKKAGVPSAALDRWIAAVGWQPLVNRQGSTWRKLGAAARAAVVDAHSARALMLAQPSVIKRPVVEWPDGGVTLGFDADAWASRLKRRPAPPRAGTVK